jgi:phosphohistidine swiveling domain-containing protein
MTRAAPPAALPPFVPPSPGSWELEQTHITRPISVFMADIFPPNMMRGFRESVREYGALLDHLEVAVINRFIYMAPRPVGAPKNAKGTPPRALFWLLQRVHPEIRRRIRQAEHAFQTRHWRHELRWWDSEVKPALAAEADGLLKEDLAAASTQELASHLRRATDFAGRSIYWHHRFNACVMVPIGDFLVHVIGWTAMPAEEILQAMRGLSPASAGAVQELAILGEALRADADGRAVLESNREPAGILAALSQRPAPVGPALDAYLHVVGLRVMGGYDVADRHAREHPDMLVKVIRASLIRVEDADHQAAAGQAVTRIRERVPPAHRAHFDELLEEARLVYRLRDERVFYGDALGVGVVRRGILGAGERLMAAGRVADPTHMVDATADEIVALLEGRGGPSAAELAERTRWRMETPVSVAPLRLGHPPSDPPPADWLPPAAARTHRIVDLVLKLMFDTRPAEPASAARRLKGFGVSPGTYEGPARVIMDVSELPTVQAGEVLVATSTASTFNVVLPLIGAIVTERGGALSHAAIVAREYGLPGVVGCPGAIKTITTGTRVKVDGATGDVWIA